jgi:hypothetical protein
VPRRRADLASFTLLLLSTCAPRIPAPPPPLSAAAPPPTGVAPSSDAALFRYDVAASEGARELTITAVIPASNGTDLEVDEDAARFVSEVRYEASGASRTLAREDPTPKEGEALTGPIWRLPACPKEGCRLVYRFALAEAARAIEEVAVAATHAGAFLSPPSAWLLHPCEPVDGQRFRLRVTSPPGITFATGLFRAPDGAADEYEAEVADLPRPPYSVFGDLRLLHAEVAGSRIEIARLPGPLDLPDEAIRQWVTGALAAVHDYYGRPPISRALLLLLPTQGHGMRFSLTLGNGGAGVIAPVGQRSTAAELAGGWELIHELLHVSFPNLPREQRWFKEGMATYVEPILRARRGLITPEQAYNRLFRRMAYGLPAPGDQGLDRTPTWGRIYWGGALFCLLADIEIRTRTQGRRSFDDALRAILAAGGNVAVRWDVAQTIAVGDAATGVTVLAELYARMALAPEAVDLDALWRRLGVVPDGASVAFDDTAPLASLRRAIVAPAPPRSADSARSLHHALDPRALGFVERRIAPDLRRERPRRR